MAKVRAKDLIPRRLYVDNKCGMLGNTGEGNQTVILFLGRQYSDSKGFGGKYLWLPLFGNIADIEGEQDIYAMINSSFKNLMVTSRLKEVHKLNLATLKGVHKLKLYAVFNNFELDTNSPYLKEKMGLRLNMAFFDTDL